jgi:hypothetical protein
MSINYHVERVTRALDILSIFHLYRLSGENEFARYITKPFRR